MTSFEMIFDEFMANNPLNESLVEVEYRAEAFVKMLTYLPNKPKESDIASAIEYLFFGSEELNDVSVEIQAKIALLVESMIHLLK